MGKARRAFSSRPKNPLPCAGFFVRLVPDIVIVKKSPLKILLKKLNSGPIPKLG
jgi:hypothetical protein